MASIVNSLSTTNTKITLPVPRPIIIRSTMNFEYWKNCFNKKKLETVIPDEEYSYQKCIKTLMWAEFCNATLVNVGNSSGFINLTFEFPNTKCKTLFENHFDTHLATVTLLDNR